MLDRLTSAATSAITDGWTYDADGNQLTQTGSTPNTFSVSSTNNQLTAVTGTLTRSYNYDAAGHTGGYGSLAFTYNDRGRMASTSANSTFYLYNALGQMIEKSGTTGTTIFMQDESGHLLGEYNGSGQLVEETIWLGDVPVATLQPNGSGGVNIYYVHTDHLNTPRKVAQPTTGTLAWRWDTDPFGTAAPNQNPAGLGTFAYNLRFPGQYYDAETGLNQNWNRDYDPIVGRYVESDPIGLSSGSVSTYTYSSGNPISDFDSLGLATNTIQSLFHPPTTSTGGQACPTSDNKQHCEELLQIDTDTCNAITKRRGSAAGAACHASATERYAACLRGKPLPPLNTWNNMVPAPNPTPVPPTLPMFPITPAPVPIIPPVIEPILIPIFP